MAIRLRGKPASSEMKNFVSGIDLERHGITDPENQYVDRFIAGQILGVKPQTLACWATTKRYDLPVHYVGRKVCYKVADLMRFIENSAKA